MRGVVPRSREGQRGGPEGTRPRPAASASASQRSAVSWGARAAAAPRCAGCADSRPAVIIVFTHTWLFLAPLRPAARPARGSRRAVRTPPCRRQGRSRYPAALSGGGCSSSWFPAGTSRSPVSVRPAGTGSAVLPSAWPSAARRGRLRQVRARAALLQSGCLGNLCARSQ